MKFLIAGFGSIGRRHLRNLRALGHEDIVLLRSHRSTLPDDEIAGLPVETELEKALAHRPDGVVIANPTALHLPVAIPAARAGCSILMEKPVSDSLEGIDELRRALDEGKSRLLVGFQFRFHPGLNKIKELIDTQAVGRILSARCQWGEYLPGWHPWEDYRQGYAARRDLGGGVVRTLTHPFDYLRWLLGDVVSLSAVVGQLSDLELDVEDMAEVSLGFAGGAQASVQVNYYQRPPVHRLELVGTHGTLAWDNADGAARLWQEESRQWETFPLAEGFDRNDLFLAETRHFIDVIQGKASPVCTLEDGEKVMEIVEAIFRSSAERRTVQL